MTVSWHVHASTLRRARTTCPPCPAQPTMPGLTGAQALLHAAFLEGRVAVRACCCVSWCSPHKEQAFLPCPAHSAVPGSTGVLLAFARCPVGPCSSFAEAMLVAPHAARVKGGAVDNFGSCVMSSQTSRVLLAHVPGQSGCEQGWPH